MSTEHLQSLLVKLQTSKTSKPIQTTKFQQLYKDGGSDAWKPNENASAESNAKAKAIGEFESDMYRKTHGLATILKWDQKERVWCEEDPGYGDRVKIHVHARWVANAYEHDDLYVYEDKNKNMTVHKYVYRDENGQETTEKFQYVGEHGKKIAKIRPVLYTRPMVRTILTQYLFDAQRHFDLVELKMDYLEFPVPTAQSNDIQEFMQLLPTFHMLRSIDFTGTRLFFEHKGHLTHNIFVLILEKRSLVSVNMKDTGFHDDAAMVLVDVLAHSSLQGKVGPRVLDLSGPQNHISHHVREVVHNSWTTTARDENKLIILQGED
jgi:hypothetical protein